MEGSTELVLRPEEQAVHGMEVAERIFTEQRRMEIARFLNVTADEPALVPYLATCATYGLDPIMGQIWLIPQRVKIRSLDGGGETWGERLRPSVGRDGFLAIARRDPRYRGIKYGVVCEHDTFEVDHSEDNPRVKVLPWGFADLPLVLHRQASKPVAFEEQSNPARWRGRILGAWAKCYVHGQPPEFYYAPIQEHIRMREKYEGRGQDRRRVVDERGRPVLEPDGAWGYVSTMSLKSAQSYVLRIALGITGVVPVDELVGGQLGGIDSTAEQLPEEQDFDWGALAEQLGGNEEAIGLTRQLREAVARVNDLAPLSWPVAKLEMVLSGRTGAEIASIVEAIEREAGYLAARASRLRAQDRSNAGEGDGAPAGDAAVEDVSDAQVVPEGEADPGPVDTTGLEARKAELEEALNDPTLSDQHRNETLAELDGVERELAAARDANQGRMGV